jgi:DNA (cytosine-5)-methyltransferase 1
LGKYGVRLMRSDDLVLPEHPAGCDLETFPSWTADRVASGARLAVDLFSGAGGLSLGAEQAGWLVAAAVDNDPKSVLTHRHNFPGLAHQADLSDPAERRSLVRLLKSAPKIDLVVGGPPCQPFSRAGRSKIRSLVRGGVRDENDPRRELWQVFLDVVLKLAPRAVLMENVPDMALGDNYRAVRSIIERLERNGYYTDLRLVDAWKFGVPQHRKRLILLARNDVSRFHWPEPTDRRTTLLETIGDLPTPAGEVGARVTSYSESDNLPDFARRLREGAPNGIVWDHMTRAVRPDDREIFDMMDSTTLYSDIPERLRRYKADTFDDKYKRLDWQDVSRSITAHIAKDGYWYIHPDQPRTLSVREAARIQTFPDRFRFAGTRSDAFRQIGNAVPPLLAETAASALSVAPEDVRPRRRSYPLLRARAALTEWADGRRNTDEWFMVPGPGTTVPVALLAALLTAKPRDRATIAPALEKARGQHRLDREALLSVELALPTFAARQAVRRLEPLADDPTSWTRLPEEIAELVRLKPAERDTFLVLCGLDVMLDSQAARRVASRFAGSESSSRFKLTDGRTDLARLMGAGEDAAGRIAALRLIGSSLCRDSEQTCDGCPLARWCIEAAQRGTELVNTGG